MASIPGIRRLFRLPQTERRATREVDEEIEFHIAMRTESLRAAGLDEAAARARALGEFGDVGAGRAELVALTRRRVRQYRRAELHEWLARDVRSALRSLRRDPLFTVGVMLTLALGVGANAAMFGMADRVLLQSPPHVRAPDQVVRVYFRSLSDGWGLVHQSGFSYPEYRSLAGESRTLDIAGQFRGRVEIGRGGNAERASALAATGNYFTVLGARPELGRFFTPAEDVPKAAARVVVLGYGFWQRRYGGSPAILGETLELDRETYTVIGVAPARFNGLDLQPVDLFLPASAFAETSFGMPDWHTRDGMSWLAMVARLRAGIAPEAAVAELTTLFARQRAAQGREPFGDSPAETAVLSRVDRAGGDSALGLDYTARVTLLLLAVSLVVLLVACANVASLMLARALRRARELAVRVALGVGRGRLVSLVAAEALLLAAGGSALGVLLAYQLGGRVAPLLLPDVDWTGGIVAGRVLGFALLLAVLCALLIAVLPAFYALRTDPSIMLRGGAREGAGHRAPLRRLLVAVQAALSVLLLTGAGLFVRSLQNATAVDFGFDGDRVIAVTWDENLQDRGEGGWAALHAEAAEQLRSLPGVAGVALAMTVPGSSATSLGGLVTGEGDTIPQLGAGGPYFNVVDTAFFRTLGIALLQGRGFTAADHRGAPRVVVVDQAFADAVWPGRNAIGRCLEVGAPGERTCARVVGVVENAMRHSVRMPPSAQFFAPLLQEDASPTGLFIRAGGVEPQRLIASVRARVAELDPDLPLANVRTLQSHYEADLRPWRVGVSLLLAFGGLALLVSLIGVYSVMAYSVTLRRHELGVRMALGARAGELLSVVIRDAARVLAIGLALGLVLVLALAGTVRSLLFEVDPRDPLVLAGVAVLLMGAGLAAALVPARRAARVQAAAMLREEA